MNTAQTILNQLGGKRFIMMTGSKQFAGDNKSLIFKVGRNSKGINKVMITLDPSDTYTMVFGSLRKYNWTEKERFEGVYADQLQELFTEATGLYTKF